MRFGSPAGFQLVGDCVHDGRAEDRNADDRSHRDGFCRRDVVGGSRGPKRVGGWLWTPRRGALNDPRHEPTAVTRVVHAARLRMGGSDSATPGRCLRTRIARPQGRCMHTTTLLLFVAELWLRSRLCCARRRCELLLSRGTAWRDPHTRAAHVDFPALAAVPSGTVMGSTLTRLPLGGHRPVRGPMSLEGDSSVDNYRGCAGAGVLLPEHRRWHLGSPVAGASEVATRSCAGSSRMGWGERA